MPKTLSATDVRVHFGEVLKTIHETDEPVIVEKNGEPIAAILTHDDYLALRHGPATDWRELVRRSQDAIASLRERGWNPDWAEIINAGREERDRQIPTSAFCGRT